jgi:hypothetical protein
VWDWNPDRAHNEPPGLDTGPLVEGPYLNAPNGHDGYIEIRGPEGPATPLILDFRNAQNPIRTDNLADTPTPWEQRCDALHEIAELRKNYYPKESRAALAQRVAIYHDLAQAHPATYVPLLNAAQDDLANW